VKNRIEIVRKSLTTDAVLIENTADLLYLTGLQLSKGVLGITKEEAILFVDGRYFAKAEREVECSVRLLEGNAVFTWLEAKGIKTVEFDGAYTSYDRYLMLKAQFKGMELEAGSSLLKEIRVVKEAKEIEALRQAADLTWRGMKHMKSLLKEGISEEELAFEFEVYVRKNGASGLSFEPIIAFGENSAYPHYRAGKAQLKKNQIVLMDVGAVMNLYRGDLTRVVFFGEPDPQLEKMLKWTQEAQKKAIALAREGSRFGQLDEAARSVFKEMEAEEFFTHGLGHGIGLETHEYPSIRATGPDKEVPLKAGMVFTVEPGLYRPGLGGVRWEDMILVTENGPETFFPDEL